MVAARADGDHAFPMRELDGVLQQVGERGNEERAIAHDFQRRIGGIVRQVDPLLVRICRDEGDAFVDQLRDDEPLLPPPQPRAEPHLGEQAFDHGPQPQVAALDHVACQPVHRDAT